MKKHGLTEHQVLKHWSGGISLVAENHNQGT